MAFSQFGIHEAVIPWGRLLFTVLIRLPSAWIFEYCGLRSLYDTLSVKTLREYMEDRTQEKLRQLEEKRIIERRKRRLRKIRGRPAEVVQHHFQV